MTEDEWYDMKDVFAVLNPEPAIISDRKLRLAACHTLRSLGDMLPFESQACIKYVEQHLDGLLKWNDVVSRVLSRSVPFLLDHMATLKQLVTRGIPGLLIASSAARAVNDCAFWAEMLHREGPNWPQWFRIVHRSGGFHRGDEDRVDGAMFLKPFHDIFGNPFRPVAFDPRWRTSTTFGLARKMYDARDFTAMPILADALQDDGCEDDAILNHCRDPHQVHVRGCWVVDLVLGKI